MKHLWKAPKFEYKSLVLKETFVKFLIVFETWYWEDSFRMVNYSLPKKYVTIDDTKFWMNVFVSLLQKIYIM